MKKVISVFIIISMLLILCPSISVNAAEIVYNNFTYRYLSDGTLECVKYSGTDTDVSILWKYNNVPVTSIADSAFQGNTSIKRVGISKSVKRIGDFAFFGCTNLQKIDIYSSVLESIGKFAFANCVSALYFTIPGSVTSIGSYSVGCTVIDNPGSSNPIVSYDGGVTVYTEKDSLGESYALSHGMHIVYNVQDYIDCIISFRDDGSAELIKYYSDKPEVLLSSSYDHHPLTTICANAFLDNQTIKKVTIPSTVVTIGATAFFGCPNLETVVLYEGLTEIGDLAFLNDPKLKSIEVPYSVEFIGNHALGFNTNINGSNQVEYQPVEDFVLSIYQYSVAEEYAYKTDLTVKYNYFSYANYKYSRLYDYAIIKGYTGSNSSIFIPSEVNGLEVKAIGERAFQENSLIDSVYCPESVYLIMDAAFSGCRNLESIYMLNVTDIESNAFFGCSSLSSVYAPKALKIGQTAFGFCNFLEQALFPNVKTVERGAFLNCWSLDTIDLDSAETIGEKAFFECWALTDIDLPSAKQIKTEAFSDCTSLSEVSLHDGLVSIGSLAFVNCNSLSNLFIPLSATSFGNFTMGVYFEDEDTLRRNEDFEMTVYAFTPAMDYAQTYNIPYRIMGDVNSDGKANVKDVTEMQRALAGYFPISSLPEELLDLDRNGIFDIKDITLMQQIIALMFTN